MLWHRQLTDIETQRLNLLNESADSVKISTLTLFINNHPPYGREQRPSIFLFFLDITTLQGCIEPEFLLLSPSSSSAENMIYVQTESNFLPSLRQAQ